MPFDSSTRNKLSRMVSDARKLLTGEFTGQMQEIYGIQPDGTVIEIDKLTHLDNEEFEIARALREKIEHIAGESISDKKQVGSAINRLIHEEAFTVFNRFAALRMCEERGLLQESVRAGMKSKGFLVYSTVCGSGLGTTFERYKTYLFCLFDEIAVDLGLLFDRYAGKGILFPRESALLELLETINRADLKDLWAEDETIGWIYQYFNSKEEREAMRQASAAPRNSHELAVRNQFFTPRYVVEFLTDNTLGRIWYEMRKGETELKEKCRYLVRRPNEVFLKPGEEPSLPFGKGESEGISDENLTQEELLKKPVYIPHRPKKDPREIRMLDPAGGSGHFGLYCFDLFEIIYQEAYDDSELGLPLQQDYPDRAEFLHEVPRLILMHNIHIIDIDPRAVQIAALALWLRAQKSYNALKLKPAERPRITKTNVVCAEPMPGEIDLLKEFTASLTPRLLGQIVEIIFEKMKLAGEAGTLLKIEEEIQDTIAKAKEQWLRGSSREQGELFPEMEHIEPVQGLLFDLSDITDEEFWEHAEEKILDALEAYAEHAENGRAMRRRLFAEDTVQGFAFIDLCRKRYDVVLMNPPFGEATYSIEIFLDNIYGKPSSRALFAPFIIRACLLTAQDGMLGSLSGRGAFYLSSYELWRRDLRSRLFFECFLDLGFGVFEGPIVECVATTAQRRRISREQLHKTDFFQVLDTLERDAAILEALHHPELSHRTFLKSLDEFDSIPNSPFAYWLPEGLFQLFKNWPPIKGQDVTVSQGMSTTDDFRYLRLSWEVPGENIYSWPPIAKGGDYATYYSDLEMRVNWIDAGKHLESNNKCVLRNKESYFRPGITWTEGTTSCFSSRILPKGAAISGSGQGIFVSNDDSHILAGLLGYLQSRVVFLMLESMVSSADLSQAGGVVRHYTTDLLGRVPMPDESKLRVLANPALKIYSIQRSLRIHDETDSNFLYLEASKTRQVPLVVSAMESVNESIKKKAETIRLACSIDRNVSRLIDLDLEEIDRLAGPLPLEHNRQATEHEIEDIINLWKAPENTLVEMAFRIFPVRRIKKLGSMIDRRLELISLILQLGPTFIAEVLCVSCIDNQTAVQEICKNVASYAVGSVFGCWDIRMALDPSLAPSLPDPFDPLPVCPPGMLVGPDGLPATPGYIVSGEWLRKRAEGGMRYADGKWQMPENDDSLSTALCLLPSDSDYPIRISWPGILVEDSMQYAEDSMQFHKDDIIVRIREVLDVLYPDKPKDTPANSTPPSASPSLPTAYCIPPTAFSIEQEACSILGVKSLHDYFRSPSGFFQDHLKRYSKSRRKAPIYWPLSTASGSYTLWIYYHRFTDQTIYLCITDYVNPKLDDTRKDIERLQAEIAKGGTGSQRNMLEKLFDFEQELKDFRDELLRVAKLPYTPNLNDGVMITASPLWKLFRHTSWRKELEECWRKLEAGEYDWAHIAYTMWPERVKEKCKTDKSIAIAHDLEYLYEAKATEPKKPRKSKNKTGGTST